MRTPHRHLLLAMMLIIATWAKASSSELVRFERTERHMGTQFTITLFANDHHRANLALQAAFDRISQLDQKMSDFLPESEINRLSTTGHLSSHVSQDVWRVLMRGQEHSRLTGGAFDVTLGPLTRLWRRARRTGKLPDADRLAHAQQAVGFQNLRLDKTDRSVQLAPGMRLDLGGIAKGDALDQAMISLRESGIRLALVNGGGDMLASEAPPGRRGWRIGLVGLSEDATVDESIWLSNQAVATSGDLWQFVEIEGQRYSHLIDPKTGLGLTRRSTVSVVARRGIDADALASAVSVMGPAKGIPWLSTQPDADGRVVYNDNGQVKIVTTPGFRQLKRSAWPSSDSER